MKKKHDKTTKTKIKTESKKRNFSFILSEKALKISAIMMAVFTAVLALLQLVRFDLFIVELQKQVGERIGTAVAIVGTFCLVYSLIFWLRLKAAKVVRFTSGMAAVIAPWAWMLWAIWTVGRPEVAVEFSTFAPFNSVAPILIFNAIWLCVALFLTDQLGLEKIYQVKDIKNEVEKAEKAVSQKTSDKKVKTSKVASKKTAKKTTKKTTKKPTKKAKK